MAPEGAGSHCGNRTLGLRSLFWGLRFSEDIFWRKAFEALAHQFPNFHFTFTLSKPADSWQGKKGHVEDHIFADIKDLAGSDFYLCGSKMMTDEMRARLKAAGVEQANKFSWEVSVRRMVQAYGEVVETAERTRL